MSSAGVARDLVVARMPNSFVGATATWNTYDGSTAWPGGLDGAENEAATTEQTYTVEVGTGADFSVDLKALVIDAVSRRAGILRIVINLPTIAAAGLSQYWSVNAALESNRPTLDVAIARRVTWTGSSDNDLNNDDNWVVAAGIAAGKPTSTDFALFSSGSESPDAGSLACDTLFIGKGYTGSIENGRRVTCKRVSIFSPGGDVSIRLMAADQTQIRVGDCKSLILDGNYDLTISRSRTSVDLSTGSVERIDAHSSRVAFVADSKVDLVRITDAKYTLDNGADVVIATGSSYGYISATTNTTAAIKVSGGYIKMLAKEVDSLTIYSGRLDFRKNIQAPLDMGAVKIYSGVLDSRTEAVTFAAQSITMFGGRLLLDGSQKTNIT
jgi:hypothetical protein